MSFCMCQSHLPACYWTFELTRKKIFFCFSFLVWLMMANEWNFCLFFFFVFRCCGEMCSNLFCQQTMWNFFWYFLANFKCCLLFWNLKKQKKILTVFFVSILYSFLRQLFINLFSFVFSNRELCFFFKLNISWVKKFIHAVDD